MSSLHGSVRGQQIFNESQAVNNFMPTIPVMFTKWSDGFEPNSQAKQNCGSGWCCTITFCTSSGSNATKTYIISLDKKDLDHEPVEAQFNIELERLSKGGVKFYHGGIQRQVHVNVALLAVLKDQPERRKGCMISLGNSRYTACWGYSANLAAIYRLLPSCLTCHAKLKSGELSDVQCSVCANWDYTSTLLAYPPPDDFPVEEIHQDLAGSLHPFKLSFDLLKYALVHAEDMYMDGTWNVKGLQAYLSVHSLNAEIIESVISCIDNEEPITIPATWSQVADIALLVDVIMHLLGLRVSKAVNRDLIKSWLIQCKVFSSFK